MWDSYATIQYSYTKQDMPSHATLLMNVSLFFYSSTNAIRATQLRNDNKLYYDM